MQWGAYITDVSSGTPAQQAGLRPGDIITAIGNDAVNQDNPFSAVLFKHAPGEKVRLTVVRGAQTDTFEVTLAARPRTG